MHEQQGPRGHMLCWVSGGRRQAGRQADGQALTLLPVVQID